MGKKDKRNDKHDDETEDKKHKSSKSLNACQRNECFLLKSSFLEDESSEFFVPKKPVDPPESPVTEKVSEDQNNILGLHSEPEKNVSDSPPVRKKKPVEEVGFTTGKVLGLDAKPAKLPPVVVGIQPEQSTPGEVKKRYHSKKHPPKKQSPRKHPPKKHLPKEIPRLEDDEAWEVTENSDSSESNNNCSYKVPRKPRSRRPSKVNKPEFCNNSRWEELQEQFLEYSNFRLLPNGSVHRDEIVESFRDFRNLKRKQFYKKGLCGDKASREDMDELFEDLHGEPASTEEIHALFADFYERKIRLDAEDDGTYKGLHLNPKFVKEFSETKRDDKKKAEDPAEPSSKKKLKKKNSSGDSTGPSKPKSMKKLKKNKSDDSSEAKSKSSKKSRSKSKDKKEKKSKKDKSSKSVKSLSSKKSKKKDKKDKSSKSLGSKKSKSSKKSKKKEKS